VSKAFFSHGFRGDDSDRAFWLFQLLR
jgi:hypothetical protein